MSTQTETLAMRAEQVIPGGVNSAQRPGARPRRSGRHRHPRATFTDDRGNTYTDYHSAFGPPLLGHNDPDVDRAVAEDGVRLDNMGIGVTPIEIELAEKLVELIPSVERVLLTMTGSEATFHAIRARPGGHRTPLPDQVPGLLSRLARRGGDERDLAAERVGGKDLLSAGILPEVADATLVVRFNDAAAVERVLQEHPGDVAAIILEPIPHNIGAVLPVPGFLERLRELATQHGTVLIFERWSPVSGTAWAATSRSPGVTPDLTTLGKAMANGWPISAIGGKAELMDQFSTTPAGRRLLAAHSTAIRAWPPRPPP